MIFGNKKDMYSSSKSTGSEQHKDSLYAINRYGDTYYCNGKAYNMSGSSLFGPDGTVWTGIENEQQIRDIIFSNIL